MKHWLETRQVLDRLAELNRRGQRAALATVVRVRGSAYRREGAKLLVAEDGSTVGNVSGGCLEQDVREVALQVLASGRPQMRSYCSGADEVSAWDLGVGCEGQVEVFVAPVGASLVGIRDLLDGDAPFALCTLASERGERGQLLVTPAGQQGTLGTAGLDSAIIREASRAMGHGRSRLHDVDGTPVFIDLFEPPPRLIVVGAGDDARPLVRLALDMGFRVVVADRRPGLLTAERFGGARLVRTDAERFVQRVAPDAACYVVLMTHSYADDEAFLREVLPASPAYVGVLGPRQRTERILRTLEAERPLDTSRLHGPVGLDIGTEGAEQVALSVIAEILAVRSGRSGMPLRERAAPIHAGIA